MTVHQSCLESGKARASIQKLLSKIVLPRVNFLTCFGNVRNNYIGVLGIYYIKNVFVAEVVKRVRKVLDSSFLLISYIQIITLSWYTLTLVFFWPLIFHFKIMKWRHLYSFLLCPYLSSNCMNIQVEEINLYSFIFLRLKLLNRSKYNREINMKSL